MWNTAKAIWPFLTELEEADVAQRLQRRRQQPGAHVDHRHLGVGTARRVENLHLVGDRGHVNDFGHVAMETLERAARRIGIEGPGRRMIGAEIVKQGAGDGGLADATLVATDENDSRFGHGTL